MNALVECIPNFSEGRRPDVIEAIVDAITGAAPVWLLDTSSDADHNRTVVTFAGAPDAVEKAAFAGIQMAAQLIDLDTHRGEHPRMGATDVVPFVPIRGVTMDECVALAKRLGARVGAELNIPVYLYSAAAIRPERENLPDIRRGEYEGIKASIGTDLARKPDFGPSELGKAGATAIGARPALIAYNVYLTTDNVDIAKKIAKALRFSSGGLRYVQASGFLVEGKAQVSMNLTNFEKTPIFRAVEMIRREAQRYGVSIAFSELVGLAPEESFIAAACWYLQLDKFESHQILERRLQSVADSPSPRTEQGTIVDSDSPSLPAERGLGGEANTFLDQVAAGTAAPGGGAVAALAGALAAALVAMVSRLTIGRKKYAEVEAEMITLSQSAEQLRDQLTRAIADDITVYTAVMNAYKIDKADPKREAAIQSAMRDAAKIPLQVMKLSLDALELAQRVAEVGNTNAVTDAGVGAHMALAAIESAALNVRINAKTITDTAQAVSYRAQAALMLEKAHALRTRILSIVRERAELL